MTLDQLRVLATIVQTGSFRAASEVLHRAQSAVSYAIKTLEEELDLVLFDRSRYRPELTEAGKAIYQKAQQVIRHAEELEVMGQEYAGGKEPIVRFALNAICPLNPIVEAIRHTTGQHPHTQLELSEEVLGGAVERVMEEEADLALTEVHDWADHLEQESWGRVTLIPVAASCFPPLQEGTPLTRESLKPYVQIVVRDSSRKNLPRTHGVLEGGAKWRVSDLNTKRCLLLEGLGWGFMPKHLIGKELNQGKLTLLPVEEYPEIAVNVCLVRRRDHKMGPVARELWSKLLELGGEF